MSKKDKKKNKIKATVKGATILDDLININSKKEAKVFCDYLIAFSKAGYTLNMILLELGMKKSNWERAYKKYKVIQTAVYDAEGFRKAHGDKLLLEMALGHRNHSPQIIKLFMGNFYEITETQDKSNDKEINKKNYTVKTSFVQSSEPMNDGQTKGVIATMVGISEDDIQSK